MFVQDWGMEDALVTIHLERNAFSDACVKLGPLEPQLLTYLSKQTAKAELKAHSLISI